MNNIIKTLLEITIYSSVMIVAILSMKAIWRGKIKSSILSLLWILVLVRLLFPITIEASFHIDSFFPKEIVETVAPSPSISIDSAVYTEVDSDFTDENTTDSVLAQNVQSEEIKTSLLDKVLHYIKGIDIWIYVLILWIAGASFFLIKTIADYIDFSKRVRIGRRVNSKFLDSSLIECKAALGIKKEISIMQCKYVSTPVTFGFKNPIVLLPVGFISQINESKLKMIILHELCHIKRRDIAKNCLWLLAKTIHWFNPLVWIAYKFYLSDLELACDEMVLENISYGDSFEYSQSLLDVIRLSKKKVKAPAALAFCEEKSKIRKRVENMIQPQKKLKLAGFTSLLLAIIMIVGCFTTACRPAPDIIIDYSPANDAQSAAEISETTV